MRSLRLDGAEHGVVGLRASRVASLIGRRDPTRDACSVRQVQTSVPAGRVTRCVLVERALLRPGDAASVDVWRDATRDAATVNAT